MADIGAGFDRCDGVTLPFGTATPAGAVTLLTADRSSFYLQEDPDSPQIEYGEQLTFSHSFQCDTQTLFALNRTYHRGLLIFDLEGNTFQVLSAQSAYLRGDRYTYKIVSECVSSFTPPDEFSVEPVEFNPTVFLNPIYSSVINYNTDANGNQINSSQPTGHQIAQVIINANNANDLLTRQANLSALNSLNISNASVLALAQQLIEVLASGADTFYLSGWKVTWSQYFFNPPDMNPGGYVEDPVSQGGLPWYFWSDDGSQASGSNILTKLAATINPTFYSGGFSWLRFADSVQKERTWFRINHSWIGGPLGRWQSLLYPAKPSN